MKKFGYVACFLFATVFSIFNQALCEPAQKHKFTKDEMVSICFDKLKKLHLQEIDFDKINKSSLQYDYKYDERFRKKFFVIKRKENGFEMEIDPDIGCVRGLMITGIRDYKTLYKEGAKPKKRKEEILAQAKNYLKIINGAIPSNAFLSEAEYVLSFWRDATYSYEGEWAVYWERREGGYKYFNDSIIIYINERTGLSKYGYNFYSQYCPPKQIHITKEKAIEIAKKNVNKIIRSPFFAGAYHGCKAGDIQSTELMIVNPNYSHSIVSLTKGMDIFNNPSARLAWVVDFACIDNKTGNKTTTPGVMVFIDAETGEVLGGG